MMSSLQPVRGTHDLMGEPLKIHNYIIETARNVSACYGFEEIATPIFEFTSVFQRTLGEASDIVNKEMYTFEDRGGESLTLRPEGTAPIARAFISEGLSRLTPLKLFYQGPMFRYERPQKGRTRQFHQLGVELLGVGKPLADIEILSLAHTLLEKLHLTNPARLEINSIGDDQSRNAFRKALVTYFEKFQNDLSEDSRKRLTTNPLRILDSKDKKDQELITSAPQLENFLNAESQKFYDDVMDGLTKLSIPFHKNHKLVRGLDYYCHTVFEFKSDALGAQDAILSGGRYDKLISDMGGPQTPGVGFAAGIERLILLSKSAPKQKSPVTVVPLGETAEKEALKLSHQLRKEGFTIDMGYSGNLSKRMKRADKMNSKAALIMGDDEIQRGVVTWKDLKTGAQQEIKITQLSSFLQQMTSDD
ncbi:MAG: histidine--tRNA ligase [Bdellovibrionales bacterium]|nr:histidine--tRNA ligase [Bdellovibrionales bacterium]